MQYSAIIDVSFHAYRRRDRECTCAIIDVSRLGMRIDIGRTGRWIYIYMSVNVYDRDPRASCVSCVVTSCPPYLRYWSLMDINGFCTRGSGVSGLMRLIRYDVMSAAPVLDRRRGYTLTPTTLYLSQSTQNYSSPEYNIV
eukprot:SAG11_NODE_16015_length_559_cov_0.995652_1_plen_140_part_00